MTRGKMWIKLKVVCKAGRHGGVNEAENTRKIMNEVEKIIILGDNKSII